MKKAKNWVYAQYENEHWQVVLSQEQLEKIIDDYFEKNDVKEMFRDCLFRKGNTFGIKHQLVCDMRNGEIGERELRPNTSSSIDEFLVVLAEMEEGEYTKKDIFGDENIVLENNIDVVKKYCEKFDIDIDELEQNEDDNWIIEYSCYDDMKDFCNFWSANKDGYDDFDTRLSCVEDDYLENWYLDDYGVHENWTYQYNDVVKTDDEKEAL